MKILFAGTPDSASIVLQRLVAAGHEIVCVLTREDSTLGRKKVLTQSSVSETAEKLGLPVLKANHLDAAILEEITKTGAEIGIVVAFGVLLKKEALAVLSHGWYNLHYSLLPKYRGAAPVQWALINGEKETGLTIFKLNEGMDTGPIFSQLPVLFQVNETAAEAISRFSELGSTMLLEGLPKLYSGAFSLVPQSGTSTAAPKLSRSATKLEFSRTATEIENMVRGANPEPMAWCMLNGEPFRILEARARSATSHSFIPGEILIDSGVLVACGQNTLLELLVVQPSSKRSMSAVDWYRGASDVRKFE